MRCVAWVGGLLLAVGSVALDGDSAWSQDVAPANTVMAVGGADGWRDGGFGYGGILWSPDGLDRPGFVAKVLAGAGTYRYLNGTVDTLGQVTLLDAMPGWRFKTGTLEVTVFAGAELQNHRLTPDDTANKARGLHGGGRFAVESWYEPTAGTMTSIAGSFASVGHSYWSRAALGWRALDLAYVGPEVLALGDDTYQQWRFGLHATALHLGAFEWSFGAGYVEDNDGRGGLYLSLGVLTRR